MAVLIWHLLRKGESYAWARPALYAKKLRDLELRAGCKPNRGQKGAASAYNIDDLIGRDLGFTGQYPKGTCNHTRDKQWPLHKT
jgi:hypothetical protein